MGGVAAAVGGIAGSLGGAGGIAGTLGTIGKAAGALSSIGGLFGGGATSAAIGGGAASAAAQQAAIASFLADLPPLPDPGPEVPIPGSPAIVRPPSPLLGPDPEFTLPELLSKLIGPPQFGGQFGTPPNLYQRPGARLAMERKLRNASVAGIREAHQKELNIQTAKHHTRKTAGLSIISGSSPGSTLSTPKLTGS